MEPTTSNGHAFDVYLERALTLLENLAALDFYRAHLPSRADEVMAEIISAYTAWPARLRERFITALPHERLGIFAVFGLRAATLSVRKLDPEWLRLGLIGYAIANYEIPPSRNVDTGLAIFYHCARTLEIETQATFDEAARYVSGPIVDIMQAFGRKPDIMLKQYGWREIKTPDGVRYKFEW